jgi:hypothetical protein
MKNACLLVAALGAICALGACGDDDSGNSPGKNGSGSAGDDGGAAGGGSGGDGAGGDGAGGKSSSGGTGGKGSTDSKDRHSISGSITASVATGVAVELTGAYKATAVPDVRGVYTFDNLADGDYVVTPSLFGYTFMPPSRAVKLKGKDIIGQDFAAIMGNPSCMTGFEKGPIAGMGRTFNDVVSGDFNGDDKLDLVAIDGSAAFFAGEGDGTLAAPVGVTTSDNARYVTAADLDGDDKLDLIATAQHANTTGSGPSQVVTISVLLGKGDGSFEDPVEYIAAGGGDGTRATIGDFDGDENLDAAIAVTADKAVAVMFGNGDGTFGDAVEFPSGTTSRAITSGDFNGDKKLDIVNTSSTPIENAASVLIGNGDGSFDSAVSYGVGKFPYSIVAGDWNKDGKLDLATANNNSTDLSVLIGKGDGTFAMSVEYRAEGMPFTIASGDFDADGKLDLVSGNGAVVGAGVFLGAGDGTFGPMTATIAPATGVTTGDFDGDGKLDIGVAGGGGAAILRNCR